MITQRVPVLLEPASTDPDPTTQAPEPVADPTTQAPEPAVDPTTQASEPAADPITQAPQPAVDPTTQAPGPAVDPTTISVVPGLVTQPGLVMITQRVPVFLEPASTDPDSAADSATGAPATQPAPTAGSQDATTAGSLTAASQAPSIADSTTAEAALSTPDTATGGNTKASLKKGNRAVQEGAVTNASSVLMCPDATGFSCIGSEECWAIGTELDTVACGTAGHVCCLTVSRACPSF